LETLLRNRILINIIPATGMTAFRRKRREVGKKTAKNATVDAMGSQSHFKSYINSSQAMWLHVGNKKRHQLR